MKKSNKVKNIILSTSFLGLVGVVAISTSLPTYYSTRNNFVNRTYSFDGKTYNNFDELFNDVSSKYFRSAKTTNERFKWSIDHENAKLYFSDPKLLRDEALKYISSTYGYSSCNIESNSNYYGANGELTSEALSKIYSGNYDELKQTIYRGRNNSIFTSEEAAKRSYLTIHDAYYFNNLYFSNKEQLELYLNNVYFLDENSEGYQGAKKVISILNSSNNFKSSAIDQNALFSNLNTVNQSNQKNIIDAKKSFANFIGLSANKYLEFQNSDSNGTLYSYYKKDEISHSSELINEFDNPDYTRLYENNGNNMYVVDLDKNDNANLFGSYIISSPKDLEMMKDKKQWYKTDSTNRIITKQKDVYLLSSLIENLLVSDTTKPEVPLNIKSLNDHVLIPYFDLLKSRHSNVYYDFLTFLQTIQKGKNFNKFYELILGYTWLINNLIAKNASEEIIVKTKKTFNEIAIYLDQLIYLIFPNNILINQNNERISFAKIFDFQSNNKNLNTDINYYVDLISTNYPQFLVTLAIMNFGIINSTFNGSAIDFKFDKFSELIKQAASYPEEKMETKYYNDYQFIYNLFSITTLDSFFNQLSSSSQFINSDLVNKEVVAKEIGSFNYFKLDYSQIPIMFDYFSTKTNFFINSQLSDNQTVQDKNSIFYKLPVSIANKIININNKATDVSNKISFKNFMLIKMLVANGINVLEYLNKFTNNDTLNASLNHLINQMSAKDFSRNFQISQNSIDVLLKISKNQNYFIEQEKRIEIANNMFNGINSIVNDLKTLTDAVNSFSKIAQNTSAFLKLASSSLNLASGVFGAVGLVMSTVSLFLDAFTPNTKFYSYVYENEKGQKYIWDGGKRTTLLWGLVETENIGIEKMQLIGPIKILEANNQEQYYFNGKKYDNLNILKKDQLRQIINGSYSSETIHEIYSWEEINREFHLKPTYIFDQENLGNWESIKDIDLQAAANSSFIPQNIIQYVYQKVAQDLINENKNSQYFNSSFEFAGGINAGIASDKRELILNILNNIKPVKIAQLPNINSNQKPISIDSSQDDGSMGDFILPAKSWSFSTIFYNETNNKYVIYDPNVKDKNTKITNEDSIDVIKIIEKQFFEQFDVDFKNVIKYDIQSTNLYSELASNISVYSICKAKLSDGQIHYFLDLKPALDWILTKMNFTIYEYPTTISIYEYNGIIFNSKQEFRNYILENMEVKNA